MAIMVKRDSMIVVRIPPLDFFGDVTIPVLEWLGRVSPNGRTPNSKLEDFILACAAVGPHLEHEALRGEGPAVAYNALTDSDYFIFKVDNNGTTFLVGREPPIPDGADVCPKPY